MTSLITATYPANCAILALPDADVRKILTLNCALAPQNVTPPGTHPVLITLGDETNVKVPWLPWLPVPDYLESIVVVPWVVHASAPGAVMANPGRIWLNGLSPMIGGRIFGFRKRLARMEDGDSSYSAQTFFARRPILNAQYTLRGEPGKPSSFPNFAPLEPIFTQSLLVRFLCIYPLMSMAMDWELEEATMQSLDMTLEIDPGAFPGIPPGTYQIEGIDRQVIGGFRLTATWRMAWPKLL
jgi:hypothetical protein